MNAKTKKVISLLFVIFLSIHTISYADQTEKSDGNKSLADIQGQKILDQLQGFWLNKEVVRKLHQTRSPSVSLGARYWSGFQIKKTAPGQYLWEQIINFHEGIFGVITGIKHSATDANTIILLCERGGNQKDLFSLDHLAHSKQIIWTHRVLSPNDRIDPEPHVDTYMRLADDFEHYINKVVLVGSYQDARGQKYKFTENFQAHWPKMHFNYKLLLDGVLGMDTLDGTDILYKWKKDCLQLFHYSGIPESNLSIDKEPFLVLSKTSDL